MSAQLLGQKPARVAPGVKLHEQITLQLGRVHEACGPARRSFAMWLAGQMQGPVLWISPAWEPGQLNPDGMMPFADPARFIFVRPTRAEDLLWCHGRGAAQRGHSADRRRPARRAGADARPADASGRRTGRRDGAAPLGLLLTPGDGGAQGVETRWHMAADHQGEARRWTLTRRRARALPPVTWQATMTAARAGLHLKRVETEDVLT